MKYARSIVFSLLAILLVSGFAQGAEKVVKRDWVLKPGVNCKLEDYRAVFGMQNIMSFGSAFDEAWVEEDGNVSASAKVSGDISSSGSSYQFAPAHGVAGVRKYYTTHISEPLEVGLTAIFKVIKVNVNSYPSNPTSVQPVPQGGAYANAMFFIRVTDIEDNKVYKKWLQNYTSCACAWLVFDHNLKADPPLTFTLKPGHHYKLEAYVETKAAAFAEPNSTAFGAGDAEMSVRVQDLQISPKNPPWVSVWSMEFVPNTYDTYDRYERLLKRDGKAYFPAQFRFNISAGGDYAAAESYVRLDCRGSKAVKVTGDLPGASAQTGQVSYKLPAGGGSWSSTVLIDTEVDPNKAPLTALPAPMVSYLMTMDKSNANPPQAAIAEYDPSNWGILIGDKAVMYDDWGTGAVLQALHEQLASKKPHLVLNTENLCYKNPKTGEITPVDEMIPSGLTLAPSLKRTKKTPTDADIQLALKDRTFIYAEKQAIGVYARAANGEFVSNSKDDLNYAGVFDFIPRPQPIILEAR